MRPNFRMTPVTVGSREMTEDILRAFDFHKERPVIDRTFAFDEVKEALTYLECGQHFGKIVLYN